MNRQRVALAAGALVVFAGCSPGRSAAPATSTSAVTTPVVTTSTTSPAVHTPTRAASGPCVGGAPPPAYQHVVWIVMENRGLDQVAGSSAAPYLDGLAAACGLAVNYSGVAHPSLPNYIALTSGSTHGITDDSGPGAHPLGGPSLFSLLGSGWRSLDESMPANCDHSSGGEYAVKHNPAPYYTSIAATCAVQDVPLTGALDLSARFTFITPNLCDDMHDCSTSAGDRWLAALVPQILASAAYRSGSLVLFITWDENDAGGSLVPTYVVAPSVPKGIRSAASFNHYSLLRTTEELLGLTPLLGAAASAPDMQAAFHL